MAVWFVVLLLQVKERYLLLLYDFCNIFSCPPKACILTSKEMASLFRVLPHYLSILLTSNP